MALRVMIVEDSPIYRKIVWMAVESTGVGFVTHLVENGRAALVLLAKEPVDVILSDINMPGMDGLELLSRVNREYPKIKTVLISSLGLNNSKLVARAIEDGAYEFIVKPLDKTYEENIEILRTFLRRIFKMILTQSGKPTQTALSGRSNPHVLSKAPEITMQKPDFLMVAASTGGPLALETLLRSIPKTFTLPILVVQHMPPDFTKVLAEILEKKTGRKVVEGSNGTRVEKEKVILAPGGHHMKVCCDENACRSIILDQGSYVNGVRPAADVLFQSIAQHATPLKIIVVVLTGMGCDGTQGMVELRQNHTVFCIGQSEASCVVYGMPRSAHEAGLCDIMLDLEEIGPYFRHFVP